MSLFYDQDQCLHENKHLVVRYNWDWKWTWRGRKRVKTQWLSCQECGLYLVDPFV